MSLIKCPECDKEVSTKVTPCPHCGTPITSKEIKVATELASKRYRLYLVFSVLVCFLGWILLSSGEKSSLHAGGSLIAIGLIGYTVAKILIWKERD